MKRRAFWVVAALLALGTVSLAEAQNGTSSTRLDDFAIPPGDGSLRVEQVAPGDGLVQFAPQAKDQSIEGSPVAERPALRPDQLTSGPQSSTQSQLSDGSNPTGLIPTAGSTAADSRPRGVIRLSGSDRCDPQLTERLLARCLQILELRAQEFNAPAPPKLSAEESLLATQRTENDRAMARSSDNRLRLATVQTPDAGLDSNQELASIYLGAFAPAQIEPKPGKLPEEAATLADIIIAITQGALPSTPD